MLCHTLLYIPMDSPHDFFWCQISHLWKHLLSGKSPLLGALGRDFNGDFPAGFSPMLTSLFKNTRIHLFLGGKRVYYLLIHLDNSWLAIVATAAGLLIIFESLGHFPFLLEVFRRTVNHQLPITWQIAYTTSPKTGDTTPAAGISHQSQITMGY